jgi:hypothetical protein
MDTNLPGSITVNSLNALALIASGSTTKDGPYKEHLAKARDVIVKQTLESLDKCKNVNSQEARTFYIQATYPLLLLAHCYSFEKSEEIRSLIEKVRDSALTSQAKDGGWSYKANIGMVFMTANLAVAFYLVKHLGIDVPESAMEKIRGYYQQAKLQLSDGALEYYVGRGRDRTVPMCISRTVFSLWPMSLLGLSKSKTYEQARGYAEKNFKQIEVATHGPSYHYFWCALSCYYSGEQNFWRMFNDNFRELIIKEQSQDGSIVVAPNKKTFMPVEYKDKFFYPSLKHSTPQTFTTPQYAIILLLHKGNLLLEKIRTSTAEQQTK